METIVGRFIASKDKTNLHTLLCLKTIYAGRPLTESFTAKEISRFWVEAQNINPGFLNSSFAPVYISKQKFFRKEGGQYTLLPSYFESFSRLDWNNIIHEIENIRNPLIYVLEILDPIDIQLGFNQLVAFLQQNNL